MQEKEVYQTTSDGKKTMSPGCHQDWSSFIIYPDAEYASFNIYHGCPPPPESYIKYTKCLLILRSISPSP